MSVAVLKIFSLSLALMTSVVLARVLGVETFGRYSFIMALVPILALPIAAGVPQLMTREIAGYVQEQRWGLYRGIVQSGYIWVVLISAALYTVYLALSSMDLIPHEAKWAVLPLGLLLVPLNGLTAVRNGVMRGLKAPFLASLPEMLVQPVLFLAFMSLLLWRSNLGLDQAMMAQVLAVFLAFLVATWLLLRIQSENVKSAQAEYQSVTWLRTLLPFTLLYVITTLNINIGTVLVGLMSTDANVAAMRIAERIGQIISVPLQMANMVIAPYIVDAWRRKDIHQIQKLSQQAARGTFIISIIPAAIIVVWADPLISFVYGHEYGKIAALPLIFVVVAQVINVFFGSVGILLSMSGHEKYTLRGQSIALIFTIGLSALLIPSMGATGAAIGVATGVLVWNVLMSVSVRKHVGIKPSVF